MSTSSVDLQWCYRGITQEASHRGGFLLILLLIPGSDRIIYWLGRYSFHLGFIMSKKPKRFVILYSNQKFSMQPPTFFWFDKTQKERASNHPINYLFRPGLSTVGCGLPNFVGSQPSNPPGLDSWGFLWDIIDGLHCTFACHG